MSIPACPIEDHSDKIRNVDSIILEGNSELARTLNQPIYPTEPNRHGCAIGIFGWLTLGAIVSIISGLVGDFLPPEILPFLIVFWCIIGVICVLGLIFFIYQRNANQQQYRNQVNKYQRIKSYRAILYYCKKHNVVFNPKNNKYCEITQYPHFLSSET
jgi:hypothetical protein